MDKMRELFESRFQDLPMDGVFWSDDTGCYTTKDDLLIPDVDFCNDMLDAFKSGHEAGEASQLISVKDELQPMNIQSICYSKGNARDKAPHFSIRMPISENCSDVTHWMPLPKGPSDE